MLAVNLDAISTSRSAIHIVNYGFDRVHDACTPVRRLTIAVRTGHAVGAATVHAPGRPPVITAVASDGSRTRLVIPQLDVYAIIELIAA
jgi:hypothetical protein